MNKKIREIIVLLRKEGFDGLLVTNPYNISYLTNYHSRDSYLVITPHKTIYFTDSRYTEEAKRNLKNCLIKQIEGPALPYLANACLKLRMRKIGFEDRHISYASYKTLLKALAPKAKPLPLSGLVENLRQVKNREEIEKIKQAVTITKMALRFIEPLLRPGETENKIAGDLERFIRYNGGYAAGSFDIIVASGPNSSFPHHVTSDRKLRNNEPVLIDLGADYHGYKSDLTRVFFLGRIRPFVKRIFDIVTEAQHRAIKTIKPTVALKDIDAAARSYITKYGLGANFCHNSGHGVGLEVHEEPRLSPRAEGSIKKGMVVTVEPGIYLPGEFGIRIEDTVLVTQEGSKIL